MCAFTLLTIRCGRRQTQSGRRSCGGGTARQETVCVDWGGGCQRQHTVVILRVTPQRTGITIRLAASLGFAFKRLFIPMCQHVTVSGEFQKEGERCDLDDDDAKD